MLLLISGLGDENTKLEFGQIYEKNYRTMYYVALKILKNKEEAEDAVHGAFVKLAEKYDTYRHLTSQEMTSLCVIIVKNKCLDMLRVSKSGLQSDLEKVDYALHGEKDQPLENVIQEEGEKELLEAMKILPEKLRLVLELRYFHEYSNGEIAKILDISKKNVEIRLYVNPEQDLMASGTYYYQEDDKSLASNQFIYVTNYSAEAGFDSDQYEFTFEDFGYYQEDGTEDEAESTDDEVSAYSASEDSGILENPISICSGTWKFTVDMDQAKDISYKKVCDQTVSDGEDDVKINRIVLSPMGCSIYITLPQSQKDSGKYFDNVHIRLKNGSLLSEEYYEMGIADCELSGDDEAADAVKVSRELDFDFRVPIDISQVKAIEIFGESIEVEACK